MNSFKTVLILLSILMLIMTGCIERIETFVVDESGNMTIETELKGDISQFGEHVALPSEPIWKINEYTVDSTKDEPSMTLKATTTIPYGEKIPFTFAKTGSENFDHHLKFPTEIKKWTEGNRTFYEFKRTYQARDYMHFRGPEDMQINEELEQRVLEQGIFNVTESDRNQYASEIGMNFSILHFFQFDDLLGQMVLKDQITIDNKRAIEPLAVQYLEDKMTTEFVLELLSKDDSTIELEYQNLIIEFRNKFASITSEITKNDYSDPNSYFWKQYDQIIFNSEVTEKLNNHTFHIYLHLPGEIVSTNGFTDHGESGTVLWEFKGEDLHDCDIPLRALSVVDNK